jgi:hypothetical protein
VDLVWEYAVVECLGCRLAWVSPTPATSVMNSFYPPDYGCYGLPTDESASLKWRLARYRFASPKAGVTPFTLAPVMKRAIGRMAELLTGKTITYTLGIPLQLPPDARIFELGYGDGGWLLAMERLGYRDLSGADLGLCPETDRLLAERGIATSDLSILEAAPVNSFDCIRLEHVFEHVPDPIALAQQLFAML